MVADRESSALAKLLLETTIREQQNQPHFPQRLQTFWKHARSVARSTFGTTTSIATAASPS
jgi:hypothetical protein